MSLTTLMKPRFQRIENKVTLFEPDYKSFTANHLISTKIYCNLKENNYLQARPDVIHFSGIKCGEIHLKSLKLYNVSSDIQRMHIIPPQSKYFRIKYTHEERLVPGFSLNILIEFTPVEWRYYYDCIRIHTEDEKNLLIPIHGYPSSSIDSEEFPSSMDFPPIPIGESLTKKIPLHCDVPVDFKFQIDYLQSHEAFIVDPLSGVIPANGSVFISIRFSPKEFITAHMKIQLLLSQFNAKPLICAVTGYSSPALALQTIKPLIKEKASLDPLSISPLERARKKKYDKIKQNGKLKNNYEKSNIQNTEVTDLQNPHSVSQILLQEPEKLKSKQIKETYSLKSEPNVEAIRQIKEAYFSKKVRENVNDEKQNQLRWQVKLGECALENEERTKVLKSRNDAIEYYKRKFSNFNSQKARKKPVTLTGTTRTTRYYNEIPPSIAKFDTYANDMWKRRYYFYSLFQQAVRKVITRIRANKSLLEFKENKSHLSKTSSLEIDENEEEDTHVMQLFEKLNSKINADNIKSVKFPYYVNADKKDDLAIDGLGLVQVKPSIVKEIEEISYAELKVPHAYKVNCYESCDITDAVDDDFAIDVLSEQLLSGAEDEIINVPINGNVEKRIKAPLKLFHPIRYQCLHVYNPMPGVVTYEQELPYSETDADFHLCPLPQFTHRDEQNPLHSTQRDYLDKDDVIKKAMTWKKFHSASSEVLADLTTLSNVWLPRWSNPFNRDILPTSVPKMLDQPSSCTVKSLQIEKEGSLLDISSLENIEQEFLLLIDPPTSSKVKSKKKEKLNVHPYCDERGHIERWRKECEVKQTIEKQFNQLGDRIKTRIDELDSLLIDEKYKTNHLSSPK